MKIAIYDCAWEYTIDTPYNEPLGGTQSAIVYFIEELAKNNIVYLFNNIKQEIIIRNVNHIPFYKYANYKDFDIIIISCVSNILYELKNALNNNNTLYCLWTGHDIDQEASLLLNKQKYKDMVDLYIFVSEWQRNRYIDNFKIQKEKTIIMRNGIGKPFEKYLYINNEKIKNSMTYCSIPWRGLHLLKPIFKQINTLYSSTVLNIFSGMNIYKQENNNDMLNEFNNMKNVNFNYGISQNKLAYELSKIEYLTYSNIFPETSCITVLQAMACGCIIITSNLGALNETMNNTNYTIDININNFNILETNKYIATFVTILHNLINMSNENKRNIIKKNKEHIIQNYTWNIICDKFIKEVTLIINNKRTYINNEYSNVLNNSIQLFGTYKWNESLTLFNSIKYYINESHYHTIKLNCGVCYYHLKNYKLSKFNFKISKSILKDFGIYRNLAMLELEHNHLFKYFKYARNAIKFNFDILFVNLLAEKVETIGNYHEAQGLYECILTLDPTNINSLNNLGNLYLLYQLKSINIDEDINKTYHKSFKICDSLNEYKKKELVYSNILFNNLYNWNLSDQDIFNRTMKWSSHFKRKDELNNIIKSFNRKNKHNKIRLGYLSSDFITHPVGYMFESILKNHDLDKFEIFCYDNSLIKENEDIIAKRLRNYNNAKWYRITNFTDEEVLNTIVNDELDILIDMMGHTRNTRINILQYKPAKVLIAYFAYPATYGVKEVDYRFTDIYANPPETQKYSLEKFYYLINGFQCYTPPIELNDTRINIRDKEYNINLCCFNNPIKLSKLTIDTFIEILKRLPNSKLYLRYLYYKSSYYRAYILKFFTDAGIKAERIDIALQPIEDCLKLYNQMDIVLDPFPYNGGTISSEALYMNTPFITLAGTNYVSRIGVSLLSHLGLEKYIANTKEEYIQKVIDLANNPIELNYLHTNIRKKMLNTDLGNTVTFTNHIEEAYIDIMNKYYQ
jgi:protein O-GlcNAc transferase